MLMGFQGDLLQWLLGFLIGRKQRVVIGNDTSSWCDAKSGVPQGLAYVVCQSDC